MTTLAADTRRKFDLSFTRVGRALRMEASETIFKHAAVGDNGSGYGQPLEAGDPFFGFAIEQAENEDGLDGAKRVRLYVRGLVELTISGASQDDIRKTVYASDDDTFTLTEGTNTPIGRVVDFIDSSTLLVYFDAWRGGLGTVAQLTGTTGGTANGAVETQTNIDTLTDSTGGAADDIIADCSTAVGTGGASADQADVNTRLGVINVNFKNLADQAITQQALNVALANNIEECVVKINDILAQAE